MSHHGSDSDGDDDNAKRRRAAKKAKKSAPHVVMGGKGVRCLNCGTEEDAHFPVRLEVLKAIGNAFEKEHAHCEPSEAGAARLAFKTPAEWLDSWDTGVSSKTIWWVMTGLNPGFGSPLGCGPDVPHDPDDFGRCYRLLAAFPDWRARLPEVSARFPAWSRLVAHWADLEKLYEEEFPTGGAPKLYDLVQKLTGASS